MNEYNKMFDHHWSLYQKILQHNYMGHDQIYSVLEDDLISHTQAPFSFLDIGCGDAQTITGRLKHTPINAYTGIDLSADALAHAQHFLTPLQIQTHLINNDFEHALADLVTQRVQFDVIFSGFALHHLAPEQRIHAFHNIYQLLDKGGCFYLIDVYPHKDEPRDIYLDRYLAKPMTDWTELNDTEKTILDDHVRSSDFPACKDTLIDIATETGFESIQCLFEDDEHANILMAFTK
ncbi:MAG: class I SAM-dependent methyltransferase [Glaciecola sp.]